MSVFQLLYVSGAVGRPTDEDIEQILAVSRKNNAAMGITGMLLYAECAFIQVLEGEAETVKALSRRISRDPRHRHYMVLCEQHSQTRAFADWQMGFRALDPSLADDQAVFEASRAALEKRISVEDGGMLLAMVLAFGHDFIAAA